MFLNDLYCHIEENNLLSKDGRYIVALSGGADSTALLVALCRLGYTVEAAHCNFHLRGRESDRDEEFCVLLCEKYEVPIHRIHFNTKEYAELHKVSIEMAARELRYGYFRQLRRDINATAICVAHHRDDLVETMMINLVRGTGIKGLRGIMSVNGDIIRPLLIFDRSDIIDFLDGIGQDYVTDSTNLTDDYTRNRIRRNILPQLRQINPSLNEAFGRTATIMTEVDDLLTNLIAESGYRISDNEIDVSRLAEDGNVGLRLHYLLDGYGLTREQEDNIKQAVIHGDATGKTWQTNRHELLYDRGRILIEPLSERKDIELRIPEAGTYVIDDNRKIRIEQMTIDNDFVIPRNPDTVAIDSKDVIFPLVVRNISPGDRFAPFGMRGTKLVSDYLTDRKKTLFDKRRQLVLTDSTGRILWLIGERIDNHYAVASDTKNIIHFSLLIKKK